MQVVLNVIIGVVMQLSVILVLFFFKMKVVYGSVLMKVVYGLDNAKSFFCILKVHTCTY